MDRPDSPAARRVISPPHLLPRLELRRPHPVSREVAPMNPGSGFFRGGDEAFAVGLDHGPFRPLAEAGDGFAAVAAGADLQTKGLLKRTPANRPKSRSAV